MPAKVDKFTGEFRVDYGTRSGLNFGSDETAELNKTFDALTPESAYSQAYAYAEHLAKEHFSSSKGYTQVTLTLKGPDGEEVDQQGLIKRLYESSGRKDPKELQEMLSENFDRGKTVVRVSVIEKILGVIGK